MTKYIILGFMRSGTSVVYETLGTHPQISAPWPEVIAYPFYEKGIKAFALVNDQQANSQEVKDTFPKLFELLIYSAHKPNATAGGIKTAYNNYKAAQIIYNTIINYLTDVKIILIVRNDLTALYASAERAKKTGLWHSWQTDIKVKDFKFKINPMKFKDYATEIIQSVNLFRQLSQTHDFIEVNYEKEILPNTSDVYYKLQRFLGVAEQELKPALQKVAPSPETFVKNYNKVKQLENLLKQTYNF